MTSTQFALVEIDSIRIVREERQRRKLTELDELADSIFRLGLINPITIARDMTLIAGERRIEACKSLGWTQIAAQYVDEEAPDHHRAIELEENIKRVGIEWADECKAVLEYHELRTSQVPGWTQNDTAAAIGIASQHISYKMEVAREHIAGNQRIINAPRYSVARGIIQRQAERKDDKALSELREKIKAPADGPAEPESILTADFNLWAPAYEGPKFNFIHCDFPYGINADKFNQGAAPLHGGYADDEETYWTLLRTLADNLDRISAESCHIMFWFSMNFYRDTLHYFRDKTDFTIDPFPLIWHKSDNVGIIPDPQRGPRRIYETCLFGSRGDRKIVRSVSNTLSLPTVRDSHMSIKPQPMLAKFFEMFVDGHTVMLDPTCGSGSSVRAAELAGAAHVIGLERDPTFAEGARTALTAARRARKVTA